MECQRDAQDVERNRLLLNQLADKWTVLVLMACSGQEPVRFNEIKRRVRKVSQKTLTQCLRRLERNGLLSRKVIVAAPLGVEYSVTPLGWSLSEPFNALQLWTDKHLSEVLKAQATFDAHSQRQPHQHFSPSGHPHERASSCEGSRARPN